MTKTKIQAIYMSSTLQEDQLLLRNPIVLHCLE